MSTQPLDKFVRPRPPPPKSEEAELAGLDRLSRIEYLIYKWVGRLKRDSEKRQKEFMDKVKAAGGDIGMNNDLWHEFTATSQASLSNSKDEKSWLQILVKLHKQEDQNIKNTLQSR